MTASHPRILLHDIQRLLDALPEDDMPRFANLRDGSNLPRSCGPQDLEFSEWGRRPPIYWPMRLLVLICLGLLLWIGWSA